MAHTPFLGPAYAARSPTLAVNRAVNLFGEIVEATRGTAAAVGGFYARPGWGAPIFTLGQGPIRGMETTDFGLFVASGNEAWIVSTTGIATQIGSFVTSAGPVYIVANTTQVAFFDAVNGYSYVAATNTFATIALPFSGPGVPVYQDGFVLINQVGTFVVWQCNLNDLTTWQALNFSSEDGQPDNIIALAELHRQVVVLKEENLAIWVNVGNPGFAFQRIEGPYPARGCVAPASVALCGEAICWVGGGENGQACIYQMTGYSADRVSTFAIDYQINSYGTVVDALGFSLLIEGHTFYVVTFPTGDETWALDLTASARLGAPMWFEWLAFANGEYSRWEANCQSVWKGQNLVGSYVNGNVYALDLNQLTDNGGVKKCLRSWRAGEPTVTTQKINYLDVQCDTGLQVPGGGNPQLMFEQSFDGGDTWTAQQFRPLGQTGQTAQDIRFTRLGSTKRGLNSDRILQISMTDQARVGWIGADVG